MGLNLATLHPQIDEMAAQLAAPEPEPVMDIIPTEVPQVEKPVGINARFKWMRFWRWERQKRHRVAIQPDGTVTFWGCSYRPTEKVIDGDRIFEAPKANEWDRENGFAWAALSEEDWQRLLKKAQRAV